MKRKLFTLLTLALLGVGSAWAQTTIGLTQANDGTPTGDYKGTLAEATYTGATNLTVAEAHGTGCGINQSGRKTTGPDGDYYATKCFRKTTKASDWEPTTWVGYTVEVSSGYKMSLTNLKATLWDANSSASYAWRVVVENSSGTALYTSDKKNSSTSSIGTLEVATPEGLSNLKTGKYTVKLQLYQNGGNKYFTVPYLTADATVETDASVTYTVTTSATPAKGGTVTPATGEQVEGSDVVLTATPNVGYKFVKWTIDGTDYTTNPYTISAISGAHTAEATFEALPKITFDKGEGSGNAPSVEYAEAGTSYTLPRAFFLYKDGATLTGWNDGTNTYVPGASYNITGDVTFTAVFTDNTVVFGDAATTVNWTFATKDGAPTISCEGSELDYVQQATINGTAIDVVMHINTKQDAGISGSKGKVNNTSGDNRAQVNKGTVFTIPAFKGMVIKVTATNTGSASASSIKFDGNDADSYESGVLTYTYTGSASTIDLIDQGSNLYPSGIVVDYPVKPTKCATPTITVGDFSFATKSYPVTITSSNKLFVSTDGTNYTEQTSPYETTATATTTYYAKATDADNILEDSEVAEKEVVYAYDNSRKFVAWVYESSYQNAPKNYSIENDQLYTALGTPYNVVAVDIKDYVSAISDAQKADLNGNLEKADLVVISEAVTGKSKGVVAVKDIIGNVPMLSMKFFGYSSGRWSWATPKNADKSVVAVTPESRGFKVFEGVTFSDGAIALFDYPNEQNHIQYVESWSSEPEGNVILAKSGDYTAIHASTTKKYFGLGLSCDDFTKYNANAVIIVKNAAAMLIAGEALDAYNANSITKNITAAGYATLCSEYPLDFTGSGLTAYIATVSGSDVSFSPVTSVPAKTGVLLKGEAGEKTITVAPSTTDVSANKFVGVLEDTKVPAGSFVLYNGNNGVGFYKTSASEFTVGANTAYLPNTIGASTSRTFIAIDDTATGISEVNAAENTGAIYNLNGVRVEKATKGLYIINGKKVLK